MKVEKRDDGWWIADTPDGVEEMGPYDRRKDADMIMAGTKRFLKMKDSEVSIDWTTRKR